MVIVALGFTAKPQDASQATIPRARLEGTEQNPFEISGGLKGQDSWRLDTEKQSLGDKTI